MRYHFYLFLVLFLGGIFLSCKSKEKVQNKPYPAAKVAEKEMNIANNDLIGRWILQKMKVGTNEFSAQQMGREISLQFLGNGTMILKNGANNAEFFTYTFSENTISTLEGLKMNVAELTDTQLTIAAEENGEKTLLVYTKKQRE